jgi:hypothetical protein
MSMNLHDLKSRMAGYALDIVSRRFGRLERRGKWVLLPWLRIKWQMLKVMFIEKFMCK